MKQDPFDKLNVQFTFSERPISTPALFRPDFRIALLLMSIKQCRGGDANLKQLHVLNWAIRSKANQAQFRAALERQASPNMLRLDPTLNRAIAIALAEHLVQLSTTGSLKVAPAGDEMLKLIDTSEICNSEKQFFQSIPKITKAEIDQLFQ